MLIDEIRSKTDLEEIDYVFLMDCLKKYASPRAKVTRMLKTGEIIRVKKGLYIFGERYRFQPVSLEILANKMYGPSYLSLEYALMFHGMIPEHVQQITSVISSPLKRKEFETPVGFFTYTRLPKKLYSVGYDLYEFSKGRSCLIATPEKALTDLIYVRGYKVETVPDLEDLLYSDLRIEPGRILEMDRNLLSEIYQSKKSLPVSLLIRLLNGNKNEPSR